MLIRTRSAVNQRRCEIKFVRRFSPATCNVGEAWWSNLASVDLAAPILQSAQVKQDPDHNIHPAAPPSASWLRCGPIHHRTITRHLLFYNNGSHPRGDVSMWSRRPC